MSAGSDAGVPDAQDLLEAVAECLRVELLPNLSGRDRYQVQVCIAAVEMVRRELDLERDTADAHAELRHATGTPDDAALVREIRAGMAEDRHAAVVEALRRHVRAELRIVRPDAVPSPLAQSSRQ